MTGRGRPRQFSLTEVIEAGLALVEELGVDALSMQALAKRLGTGSATLYNYVGSRDELVDLMLGHVLTEGPSLPWLTPDAHWSESMVDYLVGHFRAGISRPGALQLAPQRLPLHLGAAARLGQELAALEQIGFSPTRAAEVLRILAAQLVGHISVAAALATRVDEAVAPRDTKLGAAQRHLDLIGEERLYESAVRAVVASLVLELEGAAR